MAERSPSAIKRLPDVRRARKANERHVVRLRAKLRTGGQNPGATEAAYDRRRKRMVELCDRERALRGAEEGRS